MSENIGPFKIVASPYLPDGVVVLKGSGPDLIFLDLRDAKAAKMVRVPLGKEKTISKEPTHDR